MSKCRNPDPELHHCPDQHDILQRTAELSLLCLDDKWWFPVGLTGAMWYHTPVAWECNFQKCKWRYGVELEFEFHRLGDTEEWEDYPDEAAKLTNYLLSTTEKAYSCGVTADESLDRGWELILGARSIPATMKLLTRIVTDKHIAPYLRHGGNAAFHVTVDPFDTPEEQRAFHDFWNDDFFFDDFWHLAQRCDGYYCSQREHKSKRGFMKPDGDRTHYNRCNVRKNGAMEVRVFQAVYDISVIEQQLKLVHEVNKAVRSGLRSYEEILNYLKGKLKASKSLLKK